ncbi:antitoxin StbD [Aurantimicrobium minutum]|nr:antitoxin StbD [Aurantimicrobium minutum]
MKRILTSMTTTISEFKKNPNLEVKKAGDEPFAVLTNNKPSFYVISPEHYEEICEILWENDLTPSLRNRIAAINTAIPVDIDSL